MSTITTTEMRKVQEFIPWNEWSSDLEDTTRCLHFVCGIHTPDPDNLLIAKMLEGDILQNIAKLFTELGFEYRRINSEADLEDSEYGIVIYDYMYKEMVNSFGCRYTEDRRELHFVRIESGIWSHKRGTHPPELTDAQKVHDIILKLDEVDVEPIAYFAVRKPQ